MVIILDDGVGFDPNRVNSHNRLGLTIMRARAERSQGQLNIQLNIQSTLGKGTRISAVFPIRKVAEPKLEAVA